MPAPAMNPQEMTLAQLTKRVADLTAEQKAKEAIVKGLNEQVRLAQLDADKKIAAMKANCDAQCAKLKLEIAPLEHVRQAGEVLKREILVLRQEKAEAVADIKAASGEANNEAQVQIAKLTKQHQKIEAAIAACKQKVAEL